jgi:hypothetical protein
MIKFAEDIIKEIENNKKERKILLHKTMLMEKHSKRG